MTDDDRQRDAEWSWVADVYREVPGAPPEAVERAVHEAESALQPPRGFGRRVWWGAAAVAGLAGILFVGRDRGVSSPDPAGPPPDQGMAATAAPSPAALPQGDAAPAPGGRLPANPTAAATPPPPQAVSPLAIAAAPADTVPPVRGSVPATADPSPPSPMLGLGAAEPRLRAGLGDAGVRELAGIVGRAAASGVPTEPLIDRALAGVAREMPTARILAAVGRRATALQDARSALGTNASSTEITAGADALEAGATVSDVVLVRRRFPASRATAGLLALAGLAADGVPAAAAADALAQSAGASDATLLALRRGVAAEVARGVSPLAALRAQVEHLKEANEADNRRLPSAGQVPRPSPIDPPRAP